MRNPIDLGVGSHVPILAAAVARTEGPVIELGTGWWSTPLLHWMCQWKRALVSYETDREWLEVMSQFKSEMHLMRHVTDWEEAEFYGNYGVAFIDCSMDASQRPHHRPRLAKRLKGRAHFIVCHDTEADIRPAAGDYGWAELDGLFKYQSTFTGIRPWTTVYSDVEEFTL